MRHGRLRIGTWRVGTWLALLALYGQVLAGITSMPAAFAGFEAVAICHADGGQAPDPADGQHRQCLLPCALCIAMQAPLPLLALPPALPLPRRLATAAQPRASPAASGPARVVAVPPARGPPLA